jgi:hypothetical protein
MYLQCGKKKRNRVGAVTHCEMRENRYAKEGTLGNNPRVERRREIASSAPSSKASSSSSGRSSHARRAPLPPRPGAAFGLAALRGGRPKKSAAAVAGTGGAHPRGRGAAPREPLPGGELSVFPSLLFAGRGEARDAAASSSSRARKPRRAAPRGVAGGPRRASPASRGRFRAPHPPAARPTPLPVVRRDGNETELQGTARASLARRSPATMTGRERWLPRTRRSDSTPRLLSSYHHDLVVWVTTNRRCLSRRSSRREISVARKVQTVRQTVMEPDRFRLSLRHSGS